MGSQSGPQLVIIGLDGATYRVLDPMRAAGAMPNLSRLLDRGAWGELRSTTPTNSAAAWVTFMTGKTPSKHGVFEFQVRSKPAGPKSIASSRSIHGETIWEALSEAGLRVVSMNVPITYPAFPVNGAMISGIPIPNGSRNWAYPEDLGDELERSGYVISIPWRDVQGRVELFLDRLRHMTRKRAAAARYLMERYQPDVITVVFVGPDRLQHCLWQFLDSNHPEYRERDAREHAGALQNYFYELDRAIGEVLDGLPEDTTVIVLSDHGFQSAEKQLSLNEWLEDQGLLKFRRIGLNLLLEPLRQMDNPMLWRLRTWWHFNKPSGLRTLTPKPSIDWARTKAYASWDFQQGVSVNLAGREVAGTVKPGPEYDELRQWLKNQLMALRDPASGSPVVREVWFKEDYYQGPYADFAADVVLVTEEGFSSSPPPRRHMQFRSTGWASGCHERNGVLMAAGKHVQAGRLGSTPCLEDIAPTVLYRLGLPIPEDMDGRIVADLFSAAGRQALGKPQYRPPSGSNDRCNSDVFSDEESKDLQEKLRGLGYLG